jgi:hypothetical protein
MNALPSPQRCWPAELGPSIDAMECTWRARAQSILTCDNALGPLLPIEQARDVIAWHQHYLDTLRATARGNRLLRLIRGGRIDASPQH